MQYHGLIWAGLFVEDLETCVTFYRDALGLRLIRKRNDTAHFDAGNGVLFELMTGGKAASAPKEPGQQPFVLGLRVDDMDQALRELTEKGVTFIGEIGEYKGTRWAQFADPEGNRLEIKQVP